MSRKGLRYSLLLGAILLVIAGTLATTPIPLDTTHNATPSVTVDFIESVKILNANLSTNTGLISSNVESSDHASIGLSVGQFMEFLITALGRVENGNYTVRINVSDIAGNSAKFNYTFTVDAPIQQITIIDPNNGGTNTTNDVNFSISSEFPSVCHWVNGTQRIADPSLFLLMNDFNATDKNLTHTVYDILPLLGANLSAGDSASVSVTCFDGELYTPKVFTITYLPNPPLITVHNTPDPITDPNHPQAIISVTGNQQIWCEDILQPNGGYATFGANTFDNYANTISTTYTDTVTKNVNSRTITLICYNRGGDMQTVNDTIGLNYQDTIDITPVDTSLEVHTSVSNDAPNDGDSITYTTTVHNSGSPLATLTLRDTIGAGAGLLRGDNGGTALFQGPATIIGALGGGGYSPRFAGSIATASGINLTNIPHDAVITVTYTAAVSTAGVNQGETSVVRSTSSVSGFAPSAVSLTLTGTGATVPACAISSPAPASGCTCGGSAITSGTCCANGQVDPTGTTCTATKPACTVNGPAPTSGCFCTNEIIMSGKCCANGRAVALTQSCTVTTPSCTVNATAPASGCMCGSNTITSGTCCANGQVDAVGSTCTATVPTCTVGDVAPTGGCYCSNSVIKNEVCCANGQVNPVGQACSTSVPACTIQTPVPNSGCTCGNSNVTSGTCCANGQIDPIGSTCTATTPLCALNSPIPSSGCFCNNVVYGSGVCCASGSVVPFGQSCTAATFDTSTILEVYTASSTYTFAFRTDKAVNCSATAEGKPLVLTPGPHEIDSSFIAQPYALTATRTAFTAYCTTEFNGKSNHTIIVVRDADPPKILGITSDPNTCGLSDLSFTVNGTDGDGTGIVTWQYSIRDANSTILAPRNISSASNYLSVDTPTITLTSNASTIISVQAYDMLGNPSAKMEKTVKATDTTALTCDTTPPEVGIFQRTTATGTNVTLFCTDKQSGCQDTYQYAITTISSGKTCTVDGSSSSAPVGSTTLVAQPSMYCYIVKDKSGNIAQGQQRIFINQTYVVGTNATRIVPVDNSSGNKCTDGIKDQDESDVDCGGYICGILQHKLCASAKICDADADCASAVCTANTCESSSCNDKKQDGDESDVDCGGSCTPCAETLRCSLNSDCVAGTKCVSKFCAQPAQEQQPGDTQPQSSGSGPSLMQIVLLVLGGLGTLGGAGYSVLYNPTSGMGGAARGSGAPPTLGRRTDESKPIARFPEATAEHGDNLTSATTSRTTRRDETKGRSASIRERRHRERQATVAPFASGEELTNLPHVTHKEVERAFKDLDQNEAMDSIKQLISTDKLSTKDVSIALKDLESSGHLDSDAIADLKREFNLPGNKK